MPFASHSRRDQSINVRLTAGEMQLVEALATARSSSVSQIVRDALRAAIEGPANHASTTSQETRTAAL
jgi:uncharacterized protein (DUF1778 family)